MENLETTSSEAQEHERQRAKTLIDQLLSEQENPQVDSGLLSFFRGVFGFLFDIIFGTDPDAPDEAAPEAEAPISDRERLQNARNIIDSRALPKWEEFKRQHAGEAVVHRSPVDGNAQITSGFGPRRAPVPGASTNHKGLDFGARSGDANPDILASADGVVLFSGRSNGYGNLVIIGHADGTQTRYGHLTGQQMPQVGALVEQGQVIGEMGTTGRSSGIHLHYEQRNRQNVAVNPQINGQRLAVGAQVRGETVLAAAPQPEQSEDAAATRPTMAARPENRFTAANERPVAEPAKTDRQQGFHINLPEMPRELLAMQRQASEAAASTRDIMAKAAKGLTERFSIFA
jgi:hypothetical protein